MNRKRKRKRRSRSRDAHPFEAYFELGDDDELERSPVHDEDSFLEDDLDLPRGSRPFDYQRWRDDLVERGRQRQRMRRREMKRGVLRSLDVPVRPVDPDLDPDDDF